ncbi:hypothetical protein HK405_014734, partial [Cladochytrium tenue]
MSMALAAPARTVAAANAPGQLAAPVRLCGGALLVRVAAADLRVVAVESARLPEAVLRRLRDGLLGRPLDTGAVETCVAELCARLAQFWDDMAELDQTGAVGPDAAEATTTRKLALVDNCFLRLTVVDPFYPRRSPPTLRLAGPDRPRAAAAAAVAKGLPNWNPEASIKANLIGALGLRLAERSSIDNHGDGREGDRPAEAAPSCPICLDDIVADGVSCRNAGCADLFHLD